MGREIIKNRTEGGEGEERKGEERREEVRRAQERRGEKKMREDCAPILTLCSYLNPHLVLVDLDLSPLVVHHLHRVTWSPNPLTPPPPLTLSS